jgi:acetyl esterase/lipase
MKKQISGDRMRLPKMLAAAALFAADTLPDHAQDRPAKAKPFAQVPDTVSPGARKFLESLPDPAGLPALPASGDRAAWKRVWRENETANEPKVKATLKRFEPTVVKRKLGGVPVLDIKPKGWKDNGKALVHAHGGAYAMNSARSRLQASVPAADVTGLRVISVDYSLAPFAKWQKVTDEILAVMRGLEKEGYELKNIAVYGESAGGGLMAGSVLKMRDRGLGMPAAVVLWSSWSDITDRGDSAVTLKNFEPNHVYDRHLKPAADAYAEAKDQKHPYVSPVYGDYSKGFPPTLIQGGTREIFLSHFVRHYRAIDAAGGTAVLDLYDGMPHIFQVRPEMWDAPETRAAMTKMKRFLEHYLGR